MTCRIRRDPAGGVDMTYLRCDGCRRVSGVKLFGNPRLSGPAAIAAAAYLRRLQSSCGWRWIGGRDLCRKCARAAPDQLRAREDVPR